MSNSRIIRIVRIIGIAIVCLCSVSTLGAEEYTKGLGALQAFDGDALATAPLWIRIWLGFMLLTFATGLIFFVWRRATARLAVGGLIVGVIGGDFIFQALGLPMLSGAIAIVHLIFWSPALVLLLIQRPFLDSTEALPYRVWSGAMTFVISFSFVFDLRDAAIYVDHFAALGFLT